MTSRSRLFAIAAITSLVGFSRSTPGLAFEAAQPIGLCFQQLDDLARIKGLARASGWERVSADREVVGKPVDAGPSYASWTLKLDGELVIVSINDGVVNGRPTNACTVVLRRPAREVLQFVEKDMRGVPQAERSDAFQRERSFTVQHRVLGTVLANVIYGSEDQPPVIVGFVGFR